jgi:hypothetical protein
VPSPANPQSLNRYSYCLNNPLKYTDPSGHDQIIVSTGNDTYEIRDGAGNVLGTASGIDDLANQMDRLSDQSRGVDLTDSALHAAYPDLPTTNQPVDTNTPQPSTAPNIQATNNSSITSLSPKITSNYSASQYNNTSSNNPKISFGFILGTGEIIIGPIIGSLGAALFISGFFPASPTVGWGIPTGLGLTMVGYGLIDNGLRRLTSGELGLPDLNFIPPGWPF